ncbi:MAG: hypothetical protein H6600_09225 [Flavobacteriales bacterium]|nr:hypothetical protein [Flavobacteriales bacterium]
MKFLYLYVFMLVGFLPGYTQSDYSSQCESSKKKIRSSEEFSSTLHQELVYTVIPNWFGTSWDYNGYTNKPKEGAIACGYFVSTTLKHIGFNLNRYNIAKMYSSDIVKVLCMNDYWVESNYEKFLTRMKEMEDGVYIVGLSNHVGFIEQIGGRTYFIHSNYLGDNGVEKELARSSLALSYSTTFWLGNFSNNKEVKDHFLFNKEFKKKEEE